MPDRTGQRVDRIAKTKENLIADLRPPGRARMPDFSESDGPRIAALVRQAGAARTPKGRSVAYDRLISSHTPIQRCQVHKARIITERLPKPLQASVRRTLRQAWELDDAEKAERLIRNLARRLEHDAPGVRDSILEGLEKFSPSIASAYPPNCAVPWPAPISSRI